MRAEGGRVGTESSRAPIGEYDLRDVVGPALARALVLAAEEGQWDLVALIAVELATGRRSRERRSASRGQPISSDGGQPMVPRTFTLRVDALEWVGETLALQLGFRSFNPRGRRIAFMMRSRRSAFVALTANATDGTLEDMSTVAPYEIGPPLRPRIDQDNGFLDAFPQRPRPVFLTKPMVSSRSLGSLNRIRITRR
jgi:hypothetical protein